MQAAGMLDKAKLQKLMALVTVLKNDNQLCRVGQLRLYIGSLGAAYNVEAQAALGITHVLSLGIQPPPLRPGVRRFGLDVADTPSSASLLRAHLDSCLDFIAQGLACGGAVLVHCVAGHSRSITVAAAFLMQHCSLRLEEALRFCLLARPTAAPNSGFSGMLARYEAEAAAAAAAVAAATAAAAAGGGGCAAASALLRAPSSVDELEMQAY